MTENQDWTVQENPPGENPPEATSRGRDPYASKVASMLRAPREGEKHPTPPKREWGEGVVTGEPHDHYVQLANGAVITGCAGGTHYDDPNYGLIPIIATFPAGRYLTDES